LELQQEEYMRYENLPLESSYGLKFDVEFVSNVYLVNNKKVIQCNIRDITERKRAEKKLSIISSRQEAILSAVPDIIMEVNNNKVYTWANQAGIDFFGEDVIGKDASFYFEGKQDTYKIVQPLFKGEEDVIYVESWQRSKDGEKRLLAWWCRVLKDGIGNVTGALSSANDITERKLAEKEIRRLNIELEARVVERTAQLEATNKELEAFSYSVSHDLRAPLRAISGFANMLMEDFSPSLNTEAKRLLDVITTNAMNMGNLIDDLLTFSRLGRQEIKTIKINMEGMANSVYNELVSDYEKDKIDFQALPIPDAFGDPSMIRQVWRNLISNSIKYSSTKTNRTIEIGTINSETENMYYVKDNGVGFNMEFVHKLFGVFQRLHCKSEFEGTGVGLANVQRIIHRHGGRVWAEGKVDEGAAFYFTLPSGQIIRQEAI
jgi:PAS domain S-box-containing protein